jgi:hypothetical protein
MVEKGNKGQFKPGDPRAGRPKGKPNKATTAVREVFAQFVEMNAANVQALFDRVAKDDPAKALDLLARLAEFVIPKLARSETILDGEMTLATRLVIKRPTDG